MTKQTALGDSFFVGSTDVSGDTAALTSIACPRALINVSGIDKTGYERLLGRADGTMAWTGYYNPTGAHVALSLVGTAAGTAVTNASYFHGAVIGNDAVSLQGKQVDYGLTVGNDLSIAVAANVQGGSGSPTEWGVQLTAGKQTLTAGTVTSLDGGASTSFGAAAYLHAFAIASGTATVKIQDSADNASFADVTGLTFTAFSAPTSERLATAKTATLRRYTAVVVTGTFTGLTGAVNLVRYPNSQT